MNDSIDMTARSDENRRRKEGYCSLLVENCSSIDIQDLTEGYTPPHNDFDLVLCLETLEHIPKESEDKAVELISKLGDILLISAAPPNQGGTHHVNEQPKEHWINQFTERGFEFRKQLTEQVKDELSFSDVRKDNLLIFQRKNGVTDQ